MVSRGTIFDGGMGSLLIAAGLEHGRPPEEWNELQPEAVLNAHRAYLEAGADVIQTNTFGGTPARLAAGGLGDQVTQLNQAGVSLAKAAASDFPGRQVALSVGPSGKMLPPVGGASKEEIENEFEAQIGAIAGTVDLISVETMYDLREALIALETARSIGGVPVSVSITYNRTPRGFFTVMGDDVRRCADQLRDSGADMIGANCSLASGDMLELAAELRDATDLPVLCQPNAGDPDVSGGVPVYGQSADDFARDGCRLFDLGVNAIGGCCGTTPDFIRELVARRGPR